MPFFSKTLPFLAGAVGGGGSGSDELSADGSPEGTVAAPWRSMAPHGTAWHCMAQQGTAGAARAAAPVWPAPAVGEACHGDSGGGDEQQERAASARGSPHRPRPPAASNVVRAWPRPRKPQARPPHCCPLPPSPRGRSGGGATGVSDLSRRSSRLKKRFCMARSTTRPDLS